MAKITAATSKAAGPAVEAAKPKAEAKPKKAAEKRPNVFASFRRYLMESWAELQKVNWPSLQDVVRFTGVVLIAIVTVAVLLFVLDYVFAEISKLAFNF